jgi:hypothetical protein
MQIVTEFVMGRVNDSNRAVHFMVNSGRFASRLRGCLRPDAVGIRVKCGAKMVQRDPMRHGPGVGAPQLSVSGENPTSSRALH